MNIPPATPEAEIVNRRKQKRLIEIFSPLRNHPSIPSTAYKKRTLSAIKEVPTPAADTGNENHVSFNQGGDNIDADDDDAFAYGLVNTSKIFNDHVHANIKLEGLCLRIIDTPEFQRLHGLKQNGTTDFVFRGATHTRFEHSLGVAHLAERFVKTLQRNQPGLGITETDVLCVKIAGLCHDLGHGPFSHLYDGVFLKRMYPDGIDASRKKWRHEDGSIRMLRHLLIKNDIDVTEYGLNLPTAAAAAEPEAEVDEVDGSNSNSARKRRVKTHTASSPPTATSSVPVSATIPTAAATADGALHQYNDMTFIEEIINGTDEARRVGRGKDKFYLYDIVNNLRSGLDVDKLDYFQRDMKMSNVFPMPVVTFDRFIELGLVLPATPIGSAPGLTGNEIPEELPKMICYPEKMASEALNLFAARFHMHQKVYQHKAVKQVEYMITEALVLANPYIDIKGTITTHHPKGLYKISECIYDMNAMCNLKDSVIDIIMHSADPRLQPAQHIITRILCRDLYSCVGDASYSLDNGMGRYINAQSEEEIGAEIVRISENLERYGSSHVVSGRTNISSSSGGTSSSSDFVLSHGTTTTGVGFSVKSLLMDGTESEGDEEGGEGGIDDRSGKGEDEQGAQAKRQKLDNETSAEGSTNPLSQSQSQSQSQRSSLPLLLEDFIVEKMHIHYGCRALNPVTNLRFYTKTIRRDGRPLGRAVNVDQMVAAPRDFEVFKLRMFCKIPNPHKEALIRQCFELYCAEHNASAPFPSSSQG